MHMHAKFHNAESNITFALGYTISSTLPSTEYKISCRVSAQLQLAMCTGLNAISLLLLPYLFPKLGNYCVEFTLVFSSEYMTASLVVVTSAHHTVPPRSGGRHPFAHSHIHVHVHVEFKGRLQPIARVHAQAH